MPKLTVLLVICVRFSFLCFYYFLHFMCTMCTIFIINKYFPYFAEYLNVVFHKAVAVCLPMHIMSHDNVNRAHAFDVTVTI